MQARSVSSEEHLIARPLKGYVADALARSSDNPQRARDLLVEWSLDDVHLCDMLCRAGASQLVRDFYAGMRKSAASANDSRVVSLSPSEVSSRMSARISRRDFWDKYSLFGMKSLKLATKVELLDSVENRRIQAHGNLTRAKFEESVSHRLDDKQIVQNCWTIKELLSLANKCNVRM